MDNHSIEETCHRCARRFQLTQSNQADCLGTDVAVLCPTCADTIQQLRHLRSISRARINRLQPELPSTT